MLFKTGVPHSSLEFGDRTLAAISKTFRGLLKVCQRTPPTLATVLLKSTDDAVESELLRRTALGQQGSNFAWVEGRQTLYALMRLQWGCLLRTWLPPVHGGSRLCRHVRNLCWRTGSTRPWLRVGLGMRGREAMQRVVDHPGPERRPQQPDHTRGSWAICC